MTWDLRLLLPLLAIALFFILTSRITWRETRRAWLFIAGFVIFFSGPDLPDRPRRHGALHRRARHRYRRGCLSPSSAGQPTIADLTSERIMFAISMLVRVFSLASMTVLIPYSHQPRRCTASPSAGWGCRTSSPTPWT